MIRLGTGANPFLQTSRAGFNHVGLEASNAGPAEKTPKRKKKRDRETDAHQHSRQLVNIAHIVVLEG